MNKKISCCYFPTTVLFVDDNYKFLKRLQLEIDIQKVVPLLYDNPLDALQFLQEKYKYIPFTQQCLLPVEESERDCRVIKVDVSAIHRQIYNPDRFTEISVVVVDYAMPSMNGLEFCEQLKMIGNFKVILLTGEADERLAIDAFNRGLINKFIRKDSLNFSEILDSAIQELQNYYFQDQSQIVLNSLTKNPNYPFCSLGDPLFIEFFAQFCQQNSFTEYYLIDTTGSFLLLDFEGQPNWLIVKDEAAMMASAYDDEMSEELLSARIEALEKDEKILYLHANADYAHNSIEWLPCLPSAKKNINQATYYCTLVDHSKMHDIQQNEILSYRAYLDKF